MMLRGKANLCLGKAPGCLYIWLGTEICLKRYAKTAWQCGDLLKRLFCAPEMTYRDLIFPVCAWNYLLENLLAWACLDLGLMGQTRPLFLENYMLSQVLVVGARCECWSVVLAPEVLFRHLMPAGTILPFFAVLVVPRLWSRAVSIRLKF